MSDLRANKRLPIKSGQKISVLTESGHELAGWLSELSVNGFRMRTHKEITHGTVLDLVLDASQLDGIKKSVSLKALCVWYAGDEAGFQLQKPLPISDDEYLKIINFLTN